MESAPSIETVNQALQALYNNPDVVGKEKASVWLGELQRSVHAWQIADQLLTSHESLESCYFAAQTMRTKIQYAFHELPANVHQSLRDSLMEHAGKITAETAPVIVTQLSLALADLGLQMVSWQSPVQDLIQKFGSNIAQMHFLLEILTVLPEEISSRSLRLGANRRKEVTDELHKTEETVIQLLKACLETESLYSDVKIQIKVLKCMKSWYSIDAIPESIVHSTLFAEPFNKLISKDCNTNLHEAATDCICNALYCIEDTEGHPQKAKALFDAVLNLADAYHASVAEEDIDKSLNYCRMFTELAESVLQVMTDTPNQGLGDFKILELLLMCLGHHQYEVAEITFTFWYKLSEDLYHRNEASLNEMFQPYIQRLIIALCSHCQMDPDHEGVLDPSDDFYEFRVRVSELIKDVIFIVGSSTCFTHMFTNLKNQTSATSWDVSEASLFIMAAVARNILPEENEVVPQVVQAVLSIPTTAHLAVRCTTLQLIGELCEWIERHPQVIDPVLQYLLAGLQESRLACMAATALQNVSTTCKDHMKTHYPVLQYLLAGLQESRLACMAATALQNVSTTCKDHMKTHCEGLIQIVQAIDTFNITNDSATGLLKGVATILATLPHDKCADGMRQLCSFQTNAMSKLLTEGSSLPKQGAADDPTVWLDRLAAVFRYTTPLITNGQVHPCLPVIQEVWPVLAQACTKYQADVRIVERCCRCIRFAIRCLGRSSSSLLTPLVPQMVSLYQVHSHSCFLYLGSILVDEYGATKEFTQGLLDMFQAFVGPTFKLLEEQNGLRNHPDTVDDLFRLSLRFIQRAPLVFLQSQIAKPVLCCAIAACSLDHKDANASVMKFITEIVKAATNKDEKEDFDTRSALVKGLLTEHGQSLVHALIHSIIFCLPTYMASDIGEVVYEVMLVDRPTFCVWLEAVLKALPTENTAGAISVTHKQLTDFHKAVTSAERVSDVSDAVREFARLYR